MARIWRQFIAAISFIVLIGIAENSVGQSTSSPADRIAHSVDQTPVPILLRGAVSPKAAGQPESEGESRKFRTRQALILSGVAISMMAYGYFVLQYNNSRTDSEQARLRYEADVRENAQQYVDEGVSLDEITTYFAWERAYTNAANDRELAAVAGLSAFLLSFAAILDSATAGRSSSTDRSARSVVPLLGVSPATGDVKVGARIGL